MAIIITEQPQGNLLNAFNNVIIEFHTDNVSPAARALVIVENYTVELTPNQNKFYVNLQQIIAILINSDAFEDVIDIPPGSVFIYPDSELYKEFDVNIEVKLENGDSENTTITMPFTKGVQQIVREEIEYSVQEKIKLLLPYTSQVAYAACWEGLPFDISIFSNIARVITIRDKRTLITTDVNLTKGVNRLFFSNGENNFGFQEDVPLLTNHINELEFLVDGDIYLTLLLQRFDFDCGTYLKWFNENGGWSYWRFAPVHQDEVSSKTEEVINNDFKNIRSAQSNYRVVSKSKESKRTLYTGMLNNDKKRIVESLSYSPKVLLFNSSPYESFSLFNFKEVQISSSKTKLSSKNNSRELQFEIDMPKQYLQYYAG